jgi:hypothetical protein
MSAVAARPLRTGHESTGIRYRDLVARHSRSSDVSSILVDIEGQTCRMHAVTSTTVSAVSAHELNSVADTLEFLDQAPERACRAIRNVCRCAGR